MQGVLGELAGAGQILWLQRGQYTAVTGCEYVSET